MSVDYGMGESEFWGLMVFIAVGVLAIAGLGARACSVNEACAAAGYPDYKITTAGLGEAYCVKRVDQTDVVVPLEDIKP